MALDRRLQARTVALLVAAAFTGPRLAQASEPGYQIQLGIIESDNIERLPFGGSNQTIGVEELGLTWHDKRPWLDADVDADVSHLNFLQHAYGDEFIGNFLGKAQINLTPEILSWLITDNFGQAPLQPLVPITPNNVEYINYFSTGPTLSLPLGRTTELDLSGQYGTVDYQHSPLDSTNLTGAIALLHELSPLSSVSINARDERIGFRNDQLNPDYDLQEAFARYNSKGSRTQLRVDLGYSRLDMSNIHDGTPLVRLDLSRRVSASSTIGVAFGHAYADGADAFVLAQTLGGATLNTQPIVEAGAPFQDSYATLGWNFKRARTTLDLSASYFRDRYKIDPGANNARTVLDATAKRQVTPTLQLALTEYMVRWQFDTGDVSATESDTGLQLAWRVGSRLSVFVAYYLAKGSSDIPTFRYTENRIWLSIGYGRAAEVPAEPAPVRLPGRQ